MLSTALPAVAPAWTGLGWIQAMKISMRSSVVSHRGMK
jgi:hypothetical protein